MIKVIGNLAEKMEEIRYMIEYLTENYPLPGKTVVVHPVPRDTIKCNGVDAQAVIHFTSSPEIKVRLCTGPKRMEYPLLLAASIAHEYYHALQVYRDGKKYMGKRDETLEKEATRFADVTSSKVFLRMRDDKESKKIKNENARGVSVLEL